MAVCQVIMPAAVEVKVGDKLQYAPRKGDLPSDKLDMSNPHCGKMVEIKEIIYGVDKHMQEVADYKPDILDHTFPSVEKLKFAVVFQDETKVRIISAIHFWNMDPRQSVL